MQDDTVAGDSCLRDGQPAAISCHQVTLDQSLSSSVLSSWAGDEMM